MTEVPRNSIQFAYKQTLFGIVLMSRRSVPGDDPGYWQWSRWRKADFADLAIYMEKSK